MTSIGQAPVITTVHHRQATPTRPRCLAIRSMGDSLHLRSVRFGAQASQDPLFSDLKQKGYEPTVLHTEQDTREVVDFIEAVFKELHKPKDQYREDMQRIADDGGFTYIIRHQNAQGLDKPIVGTASLQRSGFIFSVAVAPEHRRQGIARTMMEGLIAEAKRRGLSQVSLESDNPAAIALYTSLGFKPQKTSNGMQSMTLDLRPKGPIRTFFNKLQSAIGWVFRAIKALLGWLFSVTATPASR
jgi:GNAT superfamily N-acetyltransferase